MTDVRLIADCPAPTNMRDAARFIAWVADARSQYTNLDRDDQALVERLRTLAARLAASHGDTPLDEQAINSIAAAAGQDSLLVRYLITTGNHTGETPSWLWSQNPLLPASTRPTAPTTAPLTDQERIERLEAEVQALRTQVNQLAAAHTAGLDDGR